MIGIFETLRTKRREEQGIGFRKELNKGFIRCWITLLGLWVKSASVNVVLVIVQWKPTQLFFLLLFLPSFIPSTCPSFLSSTHFPYSYLHTYLVRPLKLCFLLLKWTISFKIKSGFSTDFTFSFLWFLTRASLLVLWTLHS